VQAHFLLDGDGRPHDFSTTGPLGSTSMTEAEQLRSRMDAWSWAYGLADTFALALLTEAIGLGLPLAAAPALNSAQAAHPAFERSVAVLREMGVTVLYGPGVYEPGPPRIGGRPYDRELPLDALDEKVPKHGTTSLVEDN
jgi:hypothetical protein